MTTVIRCELITCKEGLYSTYIFKNLDKDEKSWNQYFAVTKLPNWNNPIPAKGEEIFLTVEVVKAGEKYIKTDGTSGTYTKDGQYFINYCSVTDSHTNIYKF